MAATEFSFDIVSRADLMEVKNAVLQAQKELANRFDFRGSIAKIDYDDKNEIELHAEDEFRLNQLKDILAPKFVKRGVDLRHIEYGKLEPAAGVSVRQKGTIKAGIPHDEAKALVKQIKDKGLKVQAQVQGEEVRVTSKSKDDLQKVIQLVKTLELPYPTSFVNMR